MSAERFAQSPLFHPTTQLPRAAEQRLYWVPLLLATAAALLFSIVTVPRIALPGELARDPQLDE